MKFVPSMQKKFLAALLKSLKIDHLNVYSLSFHLESESIVYAKVEYYVTTDMVEPLVEAFEGFHLDTSKLEVEPAPKGFVSQLLDKYLQKSPGREKRVAELALVRDEEDQKGID